MLAHKLDVSPGSVPTFGGQKRPRSGAVPIVVTRLHGRAGVCISSGERPRRAGKLRVVGGGQHHGALSDTWASAKWAIARAADTASHLGRTDLVTRAPS